MRRRAILAASVLLLCAPLLRAADEDPIAEADRLWTLRAEGAKGPVAAAAPVDAVIAACRSAIAARPDSLEARWRLMRAIYFKGEYATSGNDAKKAVFDDGRKAGEEALGLIRRSVSGPDGKPLAKADPVELAQRAKGRSDVLGCFYWAAVDWGKWALVFGKMAAVKQGAAAKIRDYTTAAIGMDPAFENGGGYRVLGRLHHQTPAVPFFTGWASRSEALRNLRLAVERAPGDFINRLYLAEAMWDYEKTNRPQARALLSALLKETPSSAAPVEDRKVQQEAEADLVAWTSR
jgi:hypothetical protein